MAIDLNPHALQACNMASTSRSDTALGFGVSVDRQIPTSCGENLWYGMVSIPDGRCTPDAEDTLQTGKSAESSSRANPNHD
jgi:hypothetical protein